MQRGEQCIVATRAFGTGKFDLQGTRCEIPGPSRMVQCVITNDENCQGGKPKVWLETDSYILLDGIRYDP